MSSTVSDELSLKNRDMARSFPCTCSGPTSKVGVPLGFRRPRVPGHIDYLDWALPQRHQGEGRTSDRPPISYSLQHANEARAGPVSRPIIITQHTLSFPRFRFLTESDLPITRLAFGTRHPGTTKFAIIGMLSVTLPCHWTVRAKLDSSLVPLRRTPFAPFHSHISPRTLQIIMSKNCIREGEETSRPPYADLPFIR